MMLVGMYVEMSFVLVSMMGRLVMELLFISLDSLVHCSSSWLCR